MVDLIRALLTQLRQLDDRVKAAKGIQVGPGAARDAARAFVDEYFRVHRESLGSHLSENAVLDCDRLMQSLLEATQHRTAVKVYRKTLRDIRGSLQQLEMTSLVAGVVKDKANSIDQVDQQIITTLSRIVPSAALSYEQATLDLLQNGRLSWRGPATDLREALRECLDQLAPDDAVKAQPGFKFETSTNGPTMKQKVRFILKLRGQSKTASQAPESAAEAVEEAVGTFVRSVYTRSSVSTHTPTDKSEVLRVRDWVRVALCELLEIA